MSLVATLSTNKLAGKLNSKDGLLSAVGNVATTEGISVAPISSQQIVAQNVAPELVDKSGSVKYPAIFVYCTKVANELREKFQVFSGRAEMVVEARVSQDRLED